MLACALQAISRSSFVLTLVLDIFSFASCAIIMVPGWADGLHEFIGLIWDTELETADSMVARLEHGLKNRGVWLHIHERLDYEIEEDGIYDFKVRVTPSKDGKREWCQWQQVAGMLHSIAAQLLPVDKTVGLELQPFRDSRKHETGIFVLKSPGRVIWHALADSLRTAWQKGGIVGARLHILVHSVEDWDAQLWQRALGEAAMIFGGLHWCLYEQARFQANSSFDRKWENYFNKIFTMVYLAKREGYRYIVSLDDDVLLPASALAFLAESGPAADQAGCGIVAPLLNNGVPSVELWAGTFLSQQERDDVYRCFAGSSTRWLHEPWHSPGLEPMPQPWNAKEWYKRVADKELTDFKGIHPVRGNRTCMEMALAATLAHIGVEWDRWRYDHRLIVDHDRTYPYLCNNAFLMRADLYAEAIERPDLQRVNGADEVPMNLLLTERNLPFCFVHGSFGIHPVYNHHPDRDRLESVVLQVIRDLERTTWTFA